MVVAGTKRNRRSLHSATPDFLWTLVALAELMRLSLKRKAHTLLSPVLRGRKSGYAPVEMTILFEHRIPRSQ
jgi:hypothetical protein